MWHFVESDSCGVHVYIESPAYTVKKALFACNSLHACTAL